MRIISQSGMIDIPYEHAELHVGAGSGGSLSSKPMQWAIYANCLGRSYKLAEYSTKERAKEELARIHKGLIFNNAYMRLQPENEEHWKGLDYVTSENP